MVTSTLEIRRTENKVVLWMPDASVALSKEAVERVSEAFRKILAEKPGEPIRLSINVGDLHVRNFNSYVELQITVHKGDSVEISSFMLDKAQTPQILQGLEQASASVFAQPA